MNVSIEILEFPLCIKNKILRIKNITKLNIEYVVGKNIVFNHSNLGLNEATIKKYIQEQEKEDKIEDKMMKKEYKNPFKG